MGYLEEIYQPYVLDTTICTQNDEGDALTLGDYGTALISSSNRTIIGIATGLFLDSDLDVYLRVEPYIEWIEHAIEGTEAMK